MKRTESEIPLVPLLRHAPKGVESLDSPIDRRSDYYRQAARQKAAPRQPLPLFTPPNVLTFLRILFVPLFMFLWFYDWRYAPLCCGLLFVLQSITDWLDGYLARKLKITSAFGAFLDPVADKVMVCATLILLSCEPPAPVTSHEMAAVAVVIISREVTMSALREWAAASGGAVHKAVKVNSLGKWKTAIQMVAMSCLLLFRKAELLLGDEPHVVEAVRALSYGSWVGLGVGAALGAWSLYNYMSGVWHFFRYPEQPKAH